MSYIGLDISKKRIGISIGVINDNNKTIITPYKTIENFTNSQIIIKTINNLKKDYKPISFIIGLPSSKYDNYKFIKNFVHKYREYLKPFIFVNEDYSTFLVNTLYKDNLIKDNLIKLQDDLAASIILERYFSHKN
jgi:RNase H-fold protein (predicted Holliday junction resolvase)